MRRALALVAITASLLTGAVAIAPAAEAGAIDKSKNGKCIQFARDQYGRTHVIRLC